MDRKQGHHRCLQFAVIFTSGMVVAACNKAQYYKKTAEREDRIDHMFEGIQKREAARPEHIDHLIENIEESEARRPENLERIRELFEKDYERNCYNWCGEGAEKRREYLRKMVRGQPENIAGTWGKMVY
ncbi:MAG: hypothetical protein HY287_07665 [Planctomycetes bacterium]|nr:hypothetical protein [Planctomycetota bacterium]MBI3834188.1 hypothetical protein [Planctomycetota bacterium]